MTKIVQLVNSCRECPNRAYYSGGVYVCTRMRPPRGSCHVEIPDMSAIPAWCPLADYPITVSSGVDVRCPTCNGNDANAPCAYPEGGQPGCLRDKRLARNAGVPAVGANTFSHHTPMVGKDEQ